ncbi:MAG: helix-turn-helix transcriptional regulator [Candidatus Paracaedibacteraceae bacterium]|nr:helix-turn-helix transcriptional regulator [Candidatus Paracaedibacteraceae bacterium]
MIKITDMAELSALIRSTRKTQHLTQEQLSAIAGVGMRFIREVEQGKPSCQIEKVFHVMKMLGISVFVTTKESNSTPKKAN